ncbi:MAG TPA: PKD domain-containing protein, partial [Bacteroidia bacterium]|nr:PKD domain-containing protein [Bacteroidia bacterium]
LMFHSDYQQINLPYGIEFSPNSKYLYISCYKAIYQCPVKDIKAINNFDSICVPVGTKRYYDFQEYNSTLRLAPDGKIYVTKTGFTLPVINYPDSAGAKCSYDSIGIDLMGRQCGHHLPDYILPNLYARQICLSDTTQIRLRATAVDSVKWDFGDGNTGFTLTADVEHLYADTGTYPLVAYVYRPGRTDTFYYPLKIYTIKPPTLGADRLICTADSLVYNVSHYTIERYAWSNGSLNSSVTLKQPGKYKVKVENYGCVAEDSVEIKTINCGYTVDGFCVGDTTRFKLDSASADSVSWDFGNGKKELITSDSINHNYTGGNYTVTATLYKDGLSVNSPKNITIHSVKKPWLGNDTLLCADDSLDINIFDASYSGYQWNNGASISSAVIKTQGMYWVKVETNGCTDGDTIRVEKTGCSISPTNFCPGDTTVFNFSHSADSVQWDFGDGNSHITSAQQVFNKYTNGGNYTASATVFKNGLSRDITIPVAITSLPALDLGPDTVACFNSTLGSKINTPGISYLWNDGTNGPFVTVLQSGKYILQIQKAGCFAKDSVTLTVEGCECEVYIPNAFTPTNNNLNETYAPVAFCELTNYRIEIFNKWGELIFSSQDINSPWDGTYRQADCPAGIYIYVITYRDSRTLKQYSEKGTVTLIR